MAARIPASMQRFNPFNEVITLHDAMDRLLADSFVRPFSDITRALETSMPIDMYEENDQLVIKTSIAASKFILNYSLTVP